MQISANWSDNTAKIENELQGVSYFLKKLFRNEVEALPEVAFVLINHDHVDFGLFVLIN